jgi:Holliday junction resolvase RusA-like endonuclease
MARWFTTSRKTEVTQTTTSIVVLIAKTTFGQTTKTMNPITFVIPVTPKSLQNSGRKAMCMGGRVIFYKAPEAKDWIKVVGFYANPHRPAKPLEGPIKLSLCFVMKRPVALNGKKFNQGRIPADKRPDCDNMAKCTTDALLGFFVDDAQITELNVSKWYAAKAETPRIEVSIQPINTHTHEYTPSSGT